MFARHLPVHHRKHDAAPRTSPRAFASARMIQRNPTLPVRARVYVQILRRIDIEGARLSPVRSIARLLTAFSNGA